MTLKLVVTTNVDGDVFELILTKSKYRVGRRSDNDLRITESYVSAYHSELNRTTEGAYELTDCGSSNGTYLNGIKVENPIAIKAGDFIKFGILKVAVKQHEDEGPTIVSLKDRATFAKKRNDDVSSRPRSGNTGKVDASQGSPGTKEISSLESEASATPTSGSARDARKLAKQEKQIARLEAELQKAKDSSDKYLKDSRIAQSDLENASEEQKKEIEKLRTENEKASRDLLKKISLLESTQSQEQKSAEATQTQLEEALSAKSEELTGTANQLSELEGSLQEKEEHLSKAESKIAKLDAANEKAGELDSELQKSKREIATLAEEKTALQSQVESKEKEWEKEHRSLQKTIGKLRTENSDEIAARQKFESSNQTSLQEQQETIRELEEKLDRITTELEKEEKSSSGLADELAKTVAVAGSVALLKTQLGESSNHADKLESEKAELVDALQQEEENGLQLKEKLETAEASYREAESQKEQLEARLRETSRSSGDLQARLDRESAEVAQLREELESAKNSVIELRSDLAARERKIEQKETELVEQEKKFSRIESELVLQLKRELGEARNTQQKLEEKEERLLKEKHSLSNSFERLNEQAKTLEAEKSESIDRERTLANDKEDLAKKLEKAEAIHSELAAKIKEEQTNAISHQELVSKLEVQLTENESESVRREQEHIAVVQAELSSRKKDHEADLQRLEKLEQKFEQLQKEKSDLDTKIRILQDEKDHLDSERESASKMLQETEKKRATLASALEDKTQIAASHENTIAEKIASIAALNIQYKQSEKELITRHEEECEKLHTEILAEKKAREDQATELQNTRAGMSEALRKSWERTEAERSRLLADGNSQLSEVEAELGRVIHAREKIEAARDSLEDELNEREERLEKMSEDMEDLQLQIKDQTEQRTLLVSGLEKTKSGLSHALHSNRLTLQETETRYHEEKENCESLRGELNEAEAKSSLLEDDLAELRENHVKEIQDWESRYDRLREEKVTLASEDANLKRIREQIRDAQAERRTIETNLKKLRAGEKSSTNKYETLQEQQESLLSEREKLKAELNAAKKELEATQKRQLQSEQKREKLADSISSSEKRIASLQTLESEIENVVERKRKQGIVSRSKIFSTPSEETTASNGEFSREDFYRKLINKLDLIDDLSKRYDNRWRYPRVAEQLTLLKSSFLDFLHDHSVKEFNLEPGTVLSLEERKRIKLIPQKESVSKKSAPLPSRTNGQRSKVITTIRPGYVYKDGGRDVIIRKAEVIVA